MHVCIIICVCVSLSLSVSHIHKNIYIYACVCVCVCTGAPARPGSGSEWSRRQQSRRRGCPRSCSERLPTSGFASTSLWTPFTTTPTRPSTWSANWVSEAVGICWLACLAAWSLVEFMYLVFFHMPGEGHRRQLGSLLLCSRDVFQALINSLCVDSEVTWSSYD